VPDRSVAQAPTVLAVDTTSRTGSLALQRAGTLLEELALDEPEGFAHVIYGHIEALLARHGVPLASIDCFAAASGPGSFTGVRVGLACVKGLAEAMAKRAVAVSNLRALASFGTAPLRAAVIDARRGEIYGAVYDAHGNAVSPEVTSNVAHWLSGLPEAAEIVAFDGVEIEGRPLVKVRALAAAVARIAAELYARGEARDPAALDANYVRRSDAELFWKE